MPLGLSGRNELLQDWPGTANMHDRPMLRWLCSALFTLLVISPSVPGNETPPPTIHIIGDSTAADKETDPPNPEHGWGQLLPRYFTRSDMIANHAVNGRSTKSFIDEGRWAAVLERLRRDDWVFIQFGHNDEKDQDPSRYTSPDGEYSTNLRRFVRETRERGGHPILCTPVARRRWNAAGELEDTHGGYPEAVRRVAAAEDVPLFDLLKLTNALECAHGIEGSKRLHLWIPAGTYVRKPEGWQDDTHYSAYGADRVAALAVQEILRQQLPLQAWLKP